MKYFFIPGHEWELSLSELKNLLKVDDIPFVEINTNKDLFVFDINFDIATSVDLFDQLGGFVRFGFIVDDPYEYLEENVLEEAIKRDTRVNFSVSVFGEPRRVQSVKSKKNKLGMDLKRWLKSKNLKCRFVSDFKKTHSSTVLLEKNDVLEDGFELNLLMIPHKDKREWGFTLGLQDYENFSKRDYDRPRSNKKKGMIPPKLARIMINLSRNPHQLLKSQKRHSSSNTNPNERLDNQNLNGDINKNDNTANHIKTLWDPFCGSGTILQEAMVLGYQVVGTDKDPKSIEETKENLSWISETYMISHKKYKVFQHDINKNLETSFNCSAVVTEPYLGPVQLEELSLDEVKKVVSTLKPLYRSIQDRLKNLQNHGRLVIVVPGFKTPNGWIDMKLPLINNTPLEEINTDLSNNPLQWDRENSIIRRNIKIYEF